MNETKQSPHNYACGGIIHHPELFKPKCCCIFENIAKVIPIPPGHGPIKLNNEEIIFHLSGDSIDRISSAIRKIVEKNNGQEKKETNL